MTNETNEAFFPQEGIYHQRLYSLCFCKKPPLMQAHFVPDNKPDSGRFTRGSSNGTVVLISPGRDQAWTWFQLARIYDFNL